MLSRFVRAKAAQWPAGGLRTLLSGTRVASPAAKSPQPVAPSTRAWYHVTPAAADAIHVVLPLALVAIGAAASADGAAAWLTAFAELFVCIAGGIVGLMAAVDAFGYVASSAGICCRRLQAHKTAPRQRLAEAAESLRAIWMFSALAAWTRVALVAGRPTALVFTLAEAQPEAPDNLALYLFKLLLVTLLVDGYMYFKHRILHSRPLFAFHRGHHTFHDPSPFASFAVAPVEAFATFWPVVFLTLPAAPVWAHAYGIWSWAL
jgi:lathosterol oxidase